MQKKERRRHKRYEVQNVHGSLLFTTDVKIVNMSIDGMAIESTRRLNVGKQYTININHRKGMSRITGNIVWCSLSRTVKTDKGELVPVYRAGIKHEGVLSEKANELIHFIEQNVVIKLEKRIFGRFKIKPQKPVNVNCEYDFLVKSISLSGMLVEAEILPDIHSTFRMVLRLDQSKIALKGRVVYVKQMEGKENAHIGMEFLEMSDENRHTLERFIRDELEDSV